MEEHRDTGGHQALLGLLVRSHSVQTQPNYAGIKSVWNTVIMICKDLILQEQVAHLDPQPLVLLWLWRWLKDVAWPEERLAWPVSI